MKKILILLILMAILLSGCLQNKSLIPNKSIAENEVACSEYCDEVNDLTMKITVGSCDEENCVCSCSII